MGKNHMRFNLGDNYGKGAGHQLYYNQSNRDSFNAVNQSFNAGNFSAGYQGYNNHQGNNAVNQSFNRGNFSAGNQSFNLGKGYSIGQYNSNVGNQSFNRGGVNAGNQSLNTSFLGSHSEVSKRLVPIRLSKCPTMISQEQKKLLFNQKFEFTAEKGNTSFTTQSQLSIGDNTGAQQQHQRVQYHQNQELNQMSSQLGHLQQQQEYQRQNQTQEELSPISELDSEGFHSSMRSRKNQEQIGAQLQKKVGQEEVRKQQIERIMQEEVLKQQMEQMQREQLQVEKQELIKKENSKKEFNLDDIEKVFKANSKHKLQNIFDWIPGMMKVLESVNISKQQIKDFFTTKNKEDKLSITSEELNNQLKQLKSNSKKEFINDGITKLEISNIVNHAFDCMEFYSNKGFLVRAFANHDTGDPLLDKVFNKSFSSMRKVKAWNDLKDVFPDTLEEFKFIVTDSIYSLIKGTFADFAHLSIARKKLLFASRNFNQYNKLLYNEFIKKDINSENGKVQYDLELQTKVLTVQLMRDVFKTIAENSEALIKQFNDGNTQNDIEQFKELMHQVIGNTLIRLNSKGGHRQDIDNIKKNALFNKYLKQWQSDELENKCNLQVEKVLEESSKKSLQENTGQNISQDTVKEVINYDNLSKILHSVLYIRDNQPDLYNKYVNEFDAILKLGHVLHTDILLLNTHLGVQTVRDGMNVGNIVKNIYDNREGVLNTAEAGVDTVKAIRNTKLHIRNAVDVVEDNIADALINKFAEYSRDSTDNKNDKITVRMASKEQIDFVIKYVKELGIDISGYEEKSDDLFKFVRGELLLGFNEAMQKISENMHNEQFNSSSVDLLGEQFGVQGNRAQHNGDNYEKYKGTAHTNKGEVRHHKSPLGNMAKVGGVYDQNVAGNKQIGDHGCDTEQEGGLFGRNGDTQLGKFVVLGHKGLSVGVKQLFKQLKNQGPLDPQQEEGGIGVVEGEYDLLDGLGQGADQGDQSNEFVGPEQGNFQIEVTGAPLPEVSGGDCDGVFAFL